MTNASVLVQAYGLVHGDRNTHYGHPLDNDRRIAALWTALLGDKLRADIEVTDVAMMMVLVKLSREQHCPKRDNRVDVAGYAETMQMIHDEIERREAEMWDVGADAVEELADEMPIEFDIPAIYDSFWGATGEDA